MSICYSETETFISVERELRCHIYSVYRRRVHANYVGWIHPSRAWIAKSKDQGRVKGVCLVSWLNPL
jgi:hypothetical protein